MAGNGRLTLGAELEWNNQLSHITLQRSRLSAALRRPVEQRRAVPSGDRRCFGTGFKENLGATFREAPPHLVFNALKSLTN